MPKSEHRMAERTLDEIVRLLQILVARSLAKDGVTQQAIAKHLRVAKADVGPLVKGVRKIGASNG